LHENVHLFALLHDGFNEDRGFFSYPLCAFGPGFDRLPRYGFIANQGTTRENVQFDTYTTPRKCSNRGSGYYLTVPPMHFVDQQMQETRMGALTPVRAFGANFALLAPGTRIREL
jgi:hypothetical protein